LCSTIQHRTTWEPRVCVRFLYTEPSGATLCRKIQHRPTREPRICIRFLYMGPSVATLCMQIQHRTTCEPRVCVWICKYTDILGDGQTHIYIYIYIYLYIYSNIALFKCLQTWFAFMNSRHSKWREIGRFLPDNPQSSMPTGSF